jgi:signal transduction histidine kinase
MDTSKPFKYKISTNKKVVDFKTNVFDDHIGNPFALFIITDITALRSFEKRSQVTKMKTIYFASIAHDLKTPINSIMGTN